MWQGNSVTPTPTPVPTRVLFVFSLPPGNRFQEIYAFERNILGLLSTYSTNTPLHVLNMFTFHQTIFINHRLYTTMIVSNSYLMKMLINIFQVILLSSSICSFFRSPGSGSGKIPGPDPEPLSTKKPLSFKFSGYKIV